MGRRITAEYRAPRRASERERGFEVVIRLRSGSHLLTPDEADALATQLRCAAAAARAKAGEPYRPAPPIDLTGLDDAA